jgi:glycosyltransferase involved in cell wall biosynthesis
VGGVPEVIKEGENGIILRAGDIKGLTDAINAVLGDNGRFAEVGKRGRDTVLDKFCWKESIQRIVKLYESAIAC